MNDTPVESAARPERMLTFRGGGWVILMSVVTFVIVGLVTVPPLLRNSMNRPQGDGTNPASYGFALEPLLVPAAQLLPKSHHRDIIEPLTNPVTMAGSDVVTWNAENRGKFLVTNDRVLGVVVGGEARAYPLGPLSAHETINDTVGGVPIAVHFNPLCRTYVAFERTIGGSVREFSATGLVHQGCHLIYIRGEHGDPEVTGESLWHPLQLRAVSGPMAEAEVTLEALPCQLMHWQDWLALHPETTVIAPPAKDDKETKERWQEMSYEPYYLQEMMIAPIEPMPEDPVAAKAQWIAIRHDGAWCGWSFEEVIGAVDAEGAWPVTCGDTEYVLHFRPDPAVVWVESADALPVVKYCAEFAWQIRQ